MYDALLQPARSDWSSEEHARATTTLSPLVQQERTRLYSTSLEAKPPRQHPHLDPLGLAEKPNTVTQKDLIRSAAIKGHGPLSGQKFLSNSYNSGLQKKIPHKPLLPTLLGPDLAWKNLVDFTHLKEFDKSIRHQLNSKHLTIDEKNAALSQKALFDHHHDELKEIFRGQMCLVNKTTTKYHSPVVLTADAALVPQPWPINLFVVHKPEVTDAANTIISESDDIFCFGWKIRSIATRTREAESSNSPIYSAPFCTKDNNYCMCLELFLNGDGRGRDTHMSLYLVMLDPDEECDELTWPFQKVITFQLINHVNVLDSIVVSFVSKLWSPSHSDKKRRDGLPRFARHDLLHYDHFTRNDEIIIKCMIDL